MKFNKFIKEKRKNCNLTQEKAADKIGVSVNTIQNWENENYTVPRMDIIPDIAKTYKVSVYDIFRVIAADMEVQAERGKLNEIFPDEMSQLYLTRKEQDVLGCYYLKCVGGKEICAFPNENYETAKIVTRLKALGLITYNVNEEACCITDLGRFVCDIIAEEPNQLFDICNCTPLDTFIIYHNYFPDTKSYILNAFLKNDEYEIKNIDISTLKVKNHITELKVIKFSSFDGSTTNKLVISGGFITENERKAIETSKTAKREKTDWDDVFDFDESLLRPVKNEKTTKCRTDVKKEFIDSVHEEINGHYVEVSKVVNNQIQYIEIVGTKDNSYFLSMNRLKEVFSEYVEMCEKIIDGETRTHVRLNQKGKEIVKMIRG